MGQLTEVWESDDEVGKDENCRAIQTIGTIFDKSSMIFQIARNIGYSHEGHEGSTKEL